MFSYKLFDVIRRPVLTEKALRDSEERSKYCFIVDPMADKSSVREAVEKIFAVRVTKVNILNVKGKTKVFRRVIGRRADRKKAIVTLEKGCSIDFSVGY